MTGDKAWKLVAPALHSSLTSDEYMDAYLTTYHALRQYKNTEPELSNYELNKEQIVTIISECDEACNELRKLREPTAHCDGRCAECLRDTFNWLVTKPKQVEALCSEIIAYKIALAEATAELCKLCKETECTGCRWDVF